MPLRRGNCRRLPASSNSGGLFWFLDCLYSNFTTGLAKVSRATVVNFKLMFFEACTHQNGGAEAGHGRFREGRWGLRCLACLALVLRRFAR